MQQFTTDAQPSPQDRLDLIEAAFEAAVDAMVVIDSNGRMLRVNEAAVEMFGYTREELVGRDVSILMPEPYRSEHAGYLARYLATLEPRIIGIGREVEGRRRNGEVFPLDLSVGEAAALGDRLFVGILRDLSSRRRLQRELVERRLEAQRHRERLAHVDRISTLGQMAAGIAHEVNQPLGAINNYAQAARMLLAREARSGDDDDRLGRVDEVLAKIGDQALRAGDVIRRLRALARAQHEEIVRVDLDDVVRSTLELARIEATSDGSSLEVELAGELPPVMADPIQIQQVILNLVRNGVESQRTAGRPEEPASAGVPTARDLGAARGGRLRYRHLGRAGGYAVHAVRLRQGGRHGDGARDQRVDRPQPRRPAVVPQQPAERSDVQHQTAQRGARGLRLRREHLEGLQR